MSKLTEHLSKKLIGYPDALPEHLRARLHNDWIIGKFIPRSWNAMGPRCGKGNPGYLPWPPRLIAGRGVARWESTFSKSILEIPELNKCTVRADDVYGKKWTCIEWNHGHPNYAQSGTVELDWSETFITPQGMIQGANIYSPSALQKFSMSGWLRLSPDYYSWWKILKRRETIEDVKEEGDDTVLFMRKGARPDHLDAYYNLTKILPVGAAGLHWE